MAKKNVIPAGNLDLENDPLAIKAGDYRGALDVTPISDGNGNTVSYEPVIGNEAIYSISPIEISGKVIRIKLPLGANTNTFDLFFKRPTYIVIANSVTFADDNNPSTLISNASTAITTAIPSATIIGSGFSSTEVTIDVSLENIASPTATWDWFVINNTGATAIAEFVTIQEAVSVDMAGPLIPTGFFDFLGKQFYSACTVRNLPESITILDVQDDGTGLIALHVPNNGIVDGTCINVQGVLDGNLPIPNSLDGEWIATKLVRGGFVDADYIVLQGSTYTAPYTLSPTAAVTINYKSVGNIGVVEYDNYNGTFTNYSLINSFQLNFRTKKQVQFYIENDSLKYSIYLTDGYNPIRVMYYYGAFMNNGFLTIDNPDGRYSYDTLNQESQLSIGDTDALIAYTETLNNGGQLKTGNYRYTCRFVTELESTTPWLPLTGPINIFSFVFASAGTPTIGTGNPDLDVSTKSNKLTISGIQTGFYKYIEVAYVIYQGTSQTAFALDRQLISGSTMTVTHTGFENQTAIDLATLITTDTNAIYVTAKSIDSLNNRLIISNLTSAQVTDFSAFFETWTHSLVNEPISTHGYNNQGGDTGAGAPSGNYIYGHPLYGKKLEGATEYFDPLNTCYKKGFMHNETYRLGARVKLKNGAFLSNIFWIDDIRIDTNPINVANPNQNRRISPLPNYQIYRNGGLANSSGETLITKINFSDIDWNYIVDGKRVIDLIDRIYIYYVEMELKYQEVLATGIFHQFTRRQTQYNSYVIGNDWTGTPMITYPSKSLYNSSSDSYGEYNWYSGCGQINPTGFYTYYTTSDNNAKNYASFYSPDLYYNGGFNLNIAGCTLRTIEYTTNLFADNFNINPANQVIGQNAFTARYYNSYGPSLNDYTKTNVISEGYYMNRGETKTFSTGKTIDKRCTWDVYDSTFNHYTLDFYDEQSLVVYCNSPIMTGGSDSIGVGYAQVYIDKGTYLKFGEKQLSTYIPTGNYIDAPIQATTSNMDVYGDVFTQASYFKLRYPLSIDNSGMTSPTFANSAWGFGTMMYTQNRVNSEMRYPQGGITNILKIAPGAGAVMWEREISNPNEVPTEYTQSYTPRNGINALPAYDPNTVNITKFPTRIAYSQSKPNGVQIDPYRTFLFADCRDLEQLNGEIVHHAVINGELLSWQQRAFQRQYFQSNGMLTDLNSSTVILGDGAALSRRGTTLSSIGSKHKWSIIKGASKGGNDVVSWINTELGYIVRFGYDGVNPISVVHNIKGFVDKNTRWADEKFTPADDEGIHGIWNDERQEYIYTVRARRNNKGLFNDQKYYDAGDTVYVFTSNSQTPDIYLARQNTNIPETVGSITFNTVAPITNPVYWIKDTNPLHRNEYTLCFNELKNGFACFYTFIPRIYGKWNKGYMSPDPTTNFGEIYLHNRGEYARWYGQFTSNPYLLGVMNEFPDLKKSFDAIEINSQIKPNDIGNAMEFFTEQHYSYLDIDDFNSDELHDILWASYIKNDATVSADNPNGLNDLDTSSLFGEYLLWKYIFKQGVYNKLFGVTLKYQPRTRTNNT